MQLIIKAKQSCLQLQIIFYIIFLLHIPILTFAGQKNLQSRVNLLPGDPSFEIGFVGWHAYTGPWKNIDLSNLNYQYRYKNESLSGIDNKVSKVGNNSVRLGLKENYRAYLTTTKTLLLKKGKYKFRGYAKCTQKTKIQLRIAPAKQTSSSFSFYAKISSEKYLIESDWNLISHTFYISKPISVIPIIDILGKNGNCWIDGLILTHNNTKLSSYDPPAPIISSLHTLPIYYNEMPQLFLTKTGQNITINFELRILWAKHKPDFKTQEPIQIVISASEPEKSPIIIRKISGITTPSKGNITKIFFKHCFRDTGIWKIHAIITTNKDSALSETTTIVATMPPSLQPYDTFFGTHQKISQISKLLGFGAIRDMHLLQWNNIQPSETNWNWPNSNELIEIKSFVDKGGLYLATLVGEAPLKTKWTAKYWGKKDYGQIPLWAGGKSDTSGGQGKRVSRIIRTNAIFSYAGRVAKQLPFLSFDIMNEPNYFMNPYEYFDVLKYSYIAIKKNSPRSFIVGISSPPIWGYLPNGRYTKFFVHPYSWFEKLFNIGALKYMDAIGIHTYDRTQKKEVPENAYGTSGQAAWAHGLAMLAKSYIGSDEKKNKIEIWVTEKGISSPSWRGDRYIKSKNHNSRVESALTQARWIVRSQIDMRSKGIAHFFIFNTPWSTAANHRYFPMEDISFTFFDTDGLPRPALISQKVLIENLSNTTHLSGGEPIDGFRFEIFRKKKNLIAVLWVYRKSEKEELNNPYEYVACPKLPSVTTQVSMFGDKVKFTCQESLKISPSPIYIIGIDTSAASKWERSLSHSELIRN